MPYSSKLHQLPRCYHGTEGRRRLSTSVCLLALFTALADPGASAQRPPTMTSFRHSDTAKAIASLDWVGLYDQLAPYTKWWKETAECARIPLPAARADSVQFYYVNAVAFAPTPTDKPNRMVIGVTYGASEQIVMSVIRARDEIAVKHEMLHQILYWWGEQDWDDDAHAEFDHCDLRVHS